MREGLVTAIFAVVHFCIPFSLAADSLQDLEARRHLINEHLDRILNGRDPCYSSLCQSQKREALTAVFRSSELLSSVDDDFISKREPGIRSALDLIRKPFQQPNYSQFPRTINEWTTWWNLRYSKREWISSDWKIFLSKIYELSQGLQVYIAVSSQMTQKQRDIFKEAWDRGLPEIADLAAKANVFKFREKIALQHGRKDQADFFHKKMLDAAVESKVLEEKFGGQLESTVNFLFPRMKLGAALSFMNITHRLLERYSFDDLFDRKLVEVMKSEALKVKEVWKAAQKFEDLELGVQGIKNFYSPTVNAEEAALFEQPIQTFLDKADAEARLTLELSSFYVGSKIGVAMLGNSAIDRFTLSGILQFLNWQEEGRSWTRKIWEVSDRSSVLQDIPVTLEVDMKRRNAQLFVAYQSMKESLLEVEFEISVLKNSNNKSQTEELK